MAQGPRVPNTNSLIPLYFVLVGLMLAALIGACQASESAASCLSIRDNDLRAMCYAKAKKHRASCLSIRDPDAKAYCYATTGRKR